MSQSVELHDIETRADCERLVRAFYEQLLVDPILGWIFTDVAHLDLETHLPVVASFWETVLLGAGTYRGGTFAPHAAIHARIGLRPGHFERWLFMWHATIDEHFAGERAEAAKHHAGRVARAFLGRLQGIPVGEPPPPGGLSVTIHGLPTAAAGSAPQSPSSAASVEPETTDLG